MEGKDGGKTWEEKDRDPDRDQGPGRPETERAGWSNSRQRVGGWGPRLPRPQQISGGEGAWEYMVLPPWLAAWPST